MRGHLYVFLAVIITSLCAVTAQPAYADPADDLAAVKKAFQNVGSVHIDFKRPRMSGSLDMVGTDKVHWTMSSGVQFIAIGPQRWLNMGGTWIKEPQAPAQATTMMQHFRTLNLEGNDIRKDYKVTDAGMTTAAGAPARKYHVVNKENGDTFDLLIGANRLPIQYIGSDGDVWTFSQYNSVADIKPPM